MTMRRPTKLSAITVQAYTQPIASEFCRFTTSVTGTFDDAASRLPVLPASASIVQRQHLDGPSQRLQFRLEYLQPQAGWCAAQWDFESLPCTQSAPDVCH